MNKQNPGLNSNFNIEYRRKCEYWADSAPKLVELMYGKKIISYFFTPRETDDGEINIYGFCYN